MRIFGLASYLLVPASFTVVKIVENISKTIYLYQKFIVN